MTILKEALHGKRGVTLFELLIAVVLVTVAVLSMSLFFPKVYHGVIYSQRRQDAKSLAATAMQNVKELPYQYIPITPSGNFPGTTNPNGGLGCDCNSLDMPNSGLAMTPTVVNGITYEVRQCINLVNRNTAGTGWDAYCPNVPPPIIAGGNGDPNATDFGLMNVRVSVKWTVGDKTESLELESFVHRQ